MPKKSPPTKVTFGGCDVAKVGPKPVDGVPVTMNIDITFEEALKLHLSIGQALAKLNSYKRSTTAGKQSALRLAFRPRGQRITVLESKIT